MRHHHKDFFAKTFSRLPAPVDLRSIADRQGGYKSEAAGGAMFPGIDSTMKKIYYFLLAGKRMSSSEPCGS